MQKSNLIGSMLLIGMLGLSNAANAQVVQVEQVEVSRGGSSILSDGFDNGNAVLGPLFANGNPSNYTLQSTLTTPVFSNAVSESGGRLLLDAQYAAPSPNALGSTGGQNSLGLRLQTNLTDPNRGLSQNSSFMASAMFAFEPLAASQQYGVRLTDGYSNNNDVVDLRIANNGTSTFIFFRHQDFLAGTITDSVATGFFTPVGASFLTLALGQNVGGSGVVNGFYGFNDAAGNLIGSLMSIGETSIFNGEDHTQFEIRALVAAVPEPESYALMLAGLVVVGTVARRRSQRA